ncbi:hypothetical protein M2324_001348 [Rhodovulum sulfidophilum]|uniref:hypothetical protein n=1 Tax=Rhodovulum sulfidophilum TaxID=35806 RepID=UPI000A58D0A8|nr:hypothetical protein [Rhodovulum sulfidophilum]MCW2302958.1 hypothetical protein [Rhodovulum sulfidophilum]
MPAIAALAGPVAFHVGRADACRLGGITARHLLGGFHDDRVTPNLTRIVKGSPGPEGW